MHTFTAICPCGCGDTVTATDEGFHATTVRVELCPTQRATAPAFIAGADIRKSAVVQAVAPTLRHRDGLVTFGGAL